MDTLRRAIKNTVEETAERGGVIWVSDEAKRLAERYSGQAPVSDIAFDLTRESLRRGVGILIGDSARDRCG